MRIKQRELTTTTTRTIESLLETYLSVSQAGERLGVCRTRIVDLCNAGRLPYIETCLGRLLAVADVDAEIKQRAARAAQQKELIS